MKIKILDVNSVKTDKYIKLEIDYKNLDKNTSATKKIISFDKDEKKVYEILKDAKSGSEWDIHLEKIGEYWKWTGFEAATTKETSKATPSPRSTYETPEERAQRQVYIIRQSSLTNAIALLKTEKQTPALKDVLEMAEEMVDFVFQSSQQGSLKAAVEDLPFNEEE